MIKKRKIKKVSVFIAIIFFSQLTLAEEIHKAAEAGDVKTLIEQIRRDYKNLNKLNTETGKYFGYSAGHIAAERGKLNAGRGRFTNGA